MVIYGAPSPRVKTRSRINSAPDFFSRQYLQSTVQAHTSLDKASIQLAGQIPLFQQAGFDPDSLCLTVVLCKWRVTWHVSAGETRVANQASATIDSA